jgi:general secretion pathway protein D
MSSSNWFRIIAAAVCLGLVTRTLGGQAADPAVVPAASAPASAPAGAAPMVELSFPENMDLKVLIDYVGKRQGINFIYDEQVGNKKVTIKAPQKVPPESLMSLLESALTMKGLALVPCDVPGMTRIEVAKALTAVAAMSTTAPGVSVETTAPLATTRVFELKYASPQQVDLVVKPFLSAATANVTVLAEHDLVIVTDYTTNMKRVADLVALIDRPRREVQVRFVAVQNQEAAALALKVTQLLAGKAKARSGAAKDATADVTVLADERTNQLVVVGAADSVAETLALVQSLDVPLAVETRTYTMTNTAPDRVDKLVKDLIGEATAKRLYKSAVDREANLLVVTTSAEIHQQVETIRKTLDKPLQDDQNPVRFYKLENAKAADVLSTLASIEGTAGLGDVSVDGVSAGPKPPEKEVVVAVGPTEAQINGPSPDMGGAEGRKSPKTNRLDLHGARVMADDASNMIIVVAKPAMQLVYEKLIKRLDTRRPQVLVEATVLALDTTDSFELGVEIAQNRTSDNGETRTLTFTSFGLSDAKKSPGSLTLTPGLGFNGALLSADIADIVVRALASDSRVKVVSRPSVLISDNAKGTLVSENEEPYASVNASTTVATTSFAGYSSAGTNIVVKPQISEGEYLKLQYEITLSSFGASKNDALPPPRQRNTLTSEALIPDGQTIVVGGLTRENFTEGVDRVPGLGQIPVLEYLFSSRHSETHKTTLFVFIRAVILRDDKFKDLKVLSREAAARAELPGDFPVSEPVEIR